MSKLQTPSRSQAGTRSLPYPEPVMSLRPQWPRHLPGAQQCFSRALVQYSCLHPGPSPSGTEESKPPKLCSDGDGTSFFDLCWQMVKAWSLRFNYFYCLQLSTVLRMCLEPGKEGMNRVLSNLMFWSPSQTQSDFPSSQLYYYPFKISVVSFQYSFQFFKLKNLFVQLEILFHIL